LLLDSAVFARDLADNGLVPATENGLDLYSDTLDEFHHLLLSGKLKPSQLASLASNLETLDRDFPRMSPSLANETMILGMRLVREVDAQDPTFEDRLKLFRDEGWRMALFPYYPATDSFLELDAALQRFLTLEAMDYPNATTKAKGLATRVSELPLPRTTNPFEEAPEILQMHRAVHAKLRLLRAAAILLSTGTAPELADPFGGTLHYESSANGLKVWSLGQNGQDDNGVGGWNDQDDIVLEGLRSSRLNR
jgi:hypothetical protein